jgi:hypothetical protein
MTIHKLPPEATERRVGFESAEGECKKK